MTSPRFGSPEWQQQFQEAMGKAGAIVNQALEQARRVLAAQAAMGWAYRGDLDQLTSVLAGMNAEQLREVSATASMLASAADEELSRRG